MREKEIFELAAGFINKGYSASDIKRMAEALMDKKTLEALWSVPRKNINNFVDRCLSDFRLEPPFLDLGCGRRSIKPEIQRKYGEDALFIGIDHYLPVGEDNDSNRLPNVIAQVEHLPLLNKCISTIFCLELLEHVPDVQEVLNEINYVLSPGGILLLSLPGTGIPKHEKLPFQRDYRRILPEQASNLLTTNGFTDIEIDTMELGGLQTNIFVTARQKG